MKTLIDYLQGKNLFDAEVYNEGIWPLFCEIIEGIDYKIVNPCVNVLDITTIVQLFLNDNNLDVENALLELHEPITVTPVEIRKCRIVPMTDEEKNGEDFVFTF